MTIQVQNQFFQYLIDPSFQRLIDFLCVLIRKWQ